MPDDYPDSPPQDPYAGQQAEQYNQIVPTAKYGGISLGNRRNPKVRDIVTAQIMELKKEIEVREAVIKQLDANPGVELTLDALRKIGV